MDAVISILVYVIIIFVVIARIKSKRRQFGKQPEKTVQTMAAPAVPSKPVNRTNSYGQESVTRTYSKNKASGINAHMAREKTNIREWEDRRNDWLARQMADERQAQRRVSEMFQLKMEHKYNCDAEMLKQFHESHCDADRVDTAKA